MGNRQPRRRFLVKKSPYGRDRTPFAMLSGGDAGVRGSSVIINLPGSSKGALESLQALFPGLLHIFPMMQGKGYGKQKKVN